MRGLLKYAFVLALGAAIGAYAFGSLNLEDPVRDHSAGDAATGEIEPSPSVTPPSFDEELDYKVAREFGSLAGWRAFLAAHPNGPYAQSARAEVASRLGADGASAEGGAAAAPSDDRPGGGLSRRIGSLASNAQSATARVERLLLGETAPSSADPGDSAGPSNRKAAAESASSVAPSSGDAAPATDAAPLHEASRDAGPADAGSRDSPPVGGADGGSGAKLAALAPEEICQRDEDRLARLRVNPSRGEVARFADELGCEKLRSQVLDLFERLAPPPAAAKLPDPTPPAAPAGNETAHAASPLARADVASTMASATCARDEERLARLRSSPSLDEAMQFAAELGCETLRPQLHRLMESLDPAGPAHEVPADRPRANLLGPACPSERAALDRLREEPSTEAAGLFWREMKCEGLRPQVRRLLESLDVAPDSVAATIAPSEPEARNPAPGEREAAASSAPAAGTDPAECRREEAELNRVRATPDLGDAKRFASTMTCGALRPQVARLLESFGD
ncbi:MAG TPA: hypothetical protein VGG79_19410 [Roseiarcus sp.]|jgi:hypothetical protein